LANALAVMASLVSLLSLLLLLLLGLERVTVLVEEFI
jgi:hypothetical protein